MSCARQSGRFAALAAVRGGVTRLASRSAYLARQTLAWRRNLLQRLAGGLRRLRPATAPPPPAVAPVDYRRLPQLDERRALTPEPPRPGQTCADCGAAAAKGGPWYHFAGGAHCADCAPPAAAKAGLSLVKESVALRPSSPVNGSQGRAANDKGPLRLVRGSCPKAVLLSDGSAGFIRIDNAWSVQTASGDQTGLAITPVLERRHGVLQTKETWTLTQTHSGRDISPYEFPTPEAAFNLAAVIAPYDWNRSFEAFNPAEVRALHNTFVAFRRAANTSVKG